MSSSNSDDKRVFGPYPDGSGGEAFADPLEVWRVLMHHTGGQLRQHLRNARDTGPPDLPGDPEEVLQQKAANRAAVEMRAFSAVNILLAATRAAFKMRPFDRQTGEGATERDCNRVLTRFIEFLAEEKKDQASS